MLRTTVIIGAGHAGGNVAKALRDHDFDGRVVLLGDEGHLPYERPPLSKGILCGSKRFDETYLWPEEAYRAKDIELRLSDRVERIQPEKKMVECVSGERLTYDALVIATGAKVRRLAVPGSELAGIHYFRTIDDSLAVRQEVSSRAHILVIGGGWIGLEVAASLRQLGVSVLLVESQNRLCGRTLPQDFTSYLRALHEAHGVEIHLNESVIAFSGGTRVESATLSDGAIVPISAAVIGIGVTPDDALARNAGLAVDDGIIVDEFGRTSDPAIYAAGDVTNHPNEFLAARVRLESWANAQNQAIAVAKTIAGKGERYAEIPWFWSDQYDINLQVIGACTASTETIWRGDRNSKKCLAVFLLGNEIQGAAAINNPRELRVIRKLMEARRHVSAELLADPGYSLHDLLK